MADTTLENTGTYERGDNDGHYTKPGTCEQGDNDGHYTKPVTCE